MLFLQEFRNYLKVSEDPLGECLGGQSCLAQTGWLDGVISQSIPEPQVPSSPPIYHPLLFASQVRETTELSNYWVKVDV